MRIGCDVASALAYAHRLAVVHRDVKPANILLSDGGAVVADFGIAKAIHASRETAGDVARRPSTLTAAGTSLGTPAYMAPEQAAGDAVDHRADLYALGVVLYEMLAGRPPFEGRTMQRMLAAHAIEPPEPIERRRPTVPPPLAALVMRLLAKEPADRMQSADEVVRALDAAAQPDGHGSAARPPNERRSLRQRLAEPLVVALLAATLGLSAALVWALRERRAPAPAMARLRFTLELPGDARLNPGTFGNAMTFSPDGLLLAYAGGTPVSRLYLRRLDDQTPRALAGTDGALNPRFSADGRWIAFVSNLALKKIPVEGGPVITIAKGVTTFAWGPGGEIVLSRPAVDGLWRLDSAGGLHRLTTADSLLGGIHSGPEFLSDGNTVVFTSASMTGGPVLGAVRLSDGVAVSLGLSGTNPIYLDGGFLVFAHPDGSVSAVRIDEKRLRVVGDPVPVLDHVAMKVLGSAEMAVAPNGTLVYLRGPIGRDVVEVDRTGAMRVLQRSEQTNAQPRVSPDGRRIAVAIGQPPYSSDIWIYDIASTTFKKLTDTGTNDRPEWAPDGRRVAWTSNARSTSMSVPSRDRFGIWWQPWDESAPAELLLPGFASAKFAGRGEFIVAGKARGTGSAAYLVPLPYDARRPDAVVLREGSVFRQFRPSHDARWLAYVSDETGTQEVYIQSLQQSGSKYPVSSGGGLEPVWAPGDTELFYRGGAAMISATITRSAELRVVRRDTLFRSAAAFGVIESGYDVMPDGRHFVMLMAATATPAPNVVVGWADEVRAKVIGAAHKGR